MHAPLAAWQFWAVLSAAFAALTAIFAKIGVENVNSDFAIFIRTVTSYHRVGTRIWETVTRTEKRSLHLASEYR